MKALDDIDAEDKASRAAATRRYERKKLLLMVATVIAPLVAHWLGMGELGPYVFSFLLVITFAHIVDREIDAAVERAKSP